MLSEFALRGEAMSQDVAIELPENLTIAQVQALHEQIEALVDDQKNDGIVAKANAVKRVDTAGLQLLLVAKEAAKQRQIQWQWHEPSAVLIDGARILGMQQRLELN